MALSLPKFGKKKDAEPSEEVSEQTSPDSGTSKTKRKRKPNEMLGSVVKESEPGAALGLLRSNERFTLPNDAGWLMLVLDVESKSFGGLSAKQSRDPDKGSIIELITGDDIEVVVTPEMLATDMLGIVPTVGTLDRMEEYSILTKAEYLWAVVSLDGEDLAVHPVAYTTYDEALEIASGRTTVANVLPDVWSWAHGEMEDRPEPGTQTEGLSILDQSEDEQVPEYQADPIQASSPADDDDDEPMLSDEGTAPMVREPEPEPEPVAQQELLDPDDEGAVDYGALDDQGGDDWDEDDEDEFYDPDEHEDEPEAADDYAEYAAQNAGREVSEGEVRQAVVRRLMPEDLDLHISLDEFDAAFSMDAPAVGIELADSDAWLADQVAEYVRQANAQIYKLHTDHIASLRRQYVELMSEHSEKVFSDMSTQNQGAQYHDLLEAARNDYDAELRAGEEETAKLRRDITERFDAEAEEAARAAAESARARFNSQNRPMRERLLSEASAEVQTRSEDRFAHRRQQLLQMRRTDAEMAMQVGATKAMMLLGKEREDQHAAEMELLKGWNERILTFVDENRKHDIARTETLADQLARDTQVDELNQAFLREREALMSDNAERMRQLEAESLALRERTLMQLRETEANSERELEKERARSASARELVDRLEEQMKSLQETYEAKYSDQIRTLREDRESFSLELERADAVQARSNKVLILLVVVMAIAALVVGMILGIAIDMPANSGVLLPMWQSLPAAGVPGT